MYSCAMEKDWNFHFTLLSKKNKKITQQERRFFRPNYFNLPFALHNNILCSNGRLVSIFFNSHTD